MPRIRKIVMWLVVAFLVYAVIKSPQRAGDILTTAWQALVDSIAAIGQFFDSILSG